MARGGAEERLGRLLAVVPWVVAHDGPQVSEVCRRFGVAEADLLADLELLFMCGLHPFTPDVLIDVDIAEGRVWIRMADYFSRPLRLSPAEGLALVSAGSALLSLPGADPGGALATALSKLETVLGAGPDESLDVELGPAPAGVLDTAREGAGERRKMEIDYYSFGRDGHSTRVVRPSRVFNAAGHWYLSAWCENAGGERLFRVDRITRAALLDDSFPGPAGAPTRARRGQDAAAVFHPGPGDTRLVLDLEPPAHWVAEQYPNDGVEAMPGSVLRVTLRSGQRAWVERLLLRAGPHATVVEGDATAGPAAATRLLARYRR
ncbi:MAG: WYL domain-containing protein [Acidimicrobiales bacterium]